MAMEQGGVPWWSNVIVAIVSIVGTHAVTVWRESGRSRNDWLQRWAGEATGIVAKISDAAIQHFVDPQSVPQTSRSAGIILNDLKRLGRVLNETRCSDPSDTKRTMDAFRAYHECITGPEDFQDESRDVRRLDDPLCERVREIESFLDDLIKRPRRLKK